MPNRAMEEKELAIALKIPADLPFLKAICWQVADLKYLTPKEMLHRYELGWQYRGVLGEPSLEELSFIQELSQGYQSWLAAELCATPPQLQNIRDCGTSQQMFKRELHQKILTILTHLNIEFLRECHAYFGGGTLVSLQHEEYRLSKDIDFMCSMTNGYHLLRQKVAAMGYDVIFSSRDRLILPNEIQANQYGIRFPVIIDGTTIKLEMVSEGRIQLGEPDYPSWSPVPCLNQIDIFAEKLLANADRWPSELVNSRDLIDLAMLRLASPIPQTAIDKAESAYQVIEPFKRAIQYFQEHPEYRQRCYGALSIETPDKIINGIDLLANDFSMKATARTLSEESPSNY